MSIENSPSNRMQLIGRGDLLPPGHCMHCLNGNCDEGYVTLNTYYDYEGEQYLCRNCVTLVIEAVNGLEFDEAEVLRGHANLVLETNGMLTRELEASNARLLAYDTVLSRFDGLKSITSSVPSSSAGEDGEGTPASDTGITGSADAGEPEPAKPVKKRGPGDVTQPASGDVTSGKSGLTL